MLADLTNKSSNGANNAASHPPGGVVKGVVRPRDDEDTILHHGGSDRHLGGSPQGVSSSVAKRFRPEGEQTPCRDSVGPLSNFGSLSPLGLSTQGCASPSISTDCRPSTGPVRPSAVMDAEFGSMLYFDDGPAPNSTMIGDLNISYCPHAGSLFNLVANRSCPATDAGSFVVIGVATPNLGEAMSQVAALLGSEDTTEASIASALDLLMQSTDGLVEPSLFKLTRTPTPRLTSVHAVPIVICSVADDPSVSRCVSAMGRPSQYLCRYFDAAPHPGPALSPLVPMFNLSAVEGLELEKGDAVPVLVDGEPFGALFSWSTDGLLERVTQKPHLASAGILRSMAFASPVHSIAALSSEVLSSNEPFSVVYFGASWCPPCLRILKELPYMVTGLAPSALPLPTEDVPGAHLHATDVTTFPSADVVGSLLKADYDTSSEVLELFGVERIPTFLVIDGTKLRRGVVAQGTLSEGLKLAAVGMLQNSSRDSVAAFIRDATGTTLVATPLPVCEEAQTHVFDLEADF